MYIFPVNKYAQELPKRLRKYWGEIAVKNIPGLAPNGEVSVEEREQFRRQFERTSVLSKDGSPLRVDDIPTMSKEQKRKYVARARAYYKQSKKEIERAQFNPAAYIRKLYQLGYELVGIVNDAYHDIALREKKPFQILFKKDHYFVLIEDHFRPVGKGFALKLYAERWGDTYLDKDYRHSTLVRFLKLVHTDKISQEDRYVDAIAQAVQNFELVTKAMDHGNIALVHGKTFTA